MIYKYEYIFKKNLFKENIEIVQEFRILVGKLMRGGVQGSLPKHVLNK